MQTGKFMTYKIIRQALLAATAICMLGSCKKYLEVLPKGSKVPQTYEDYLALMENKQVHQIGMSDQVYIINEFYISPDYLRTLSIASINYNWLENEDRVILKDDDDDYNAIYKGIFTNNVVINNVGKDAGSTSQTQELIAQCRVNRALFYFHLVNSYAKTYNPATAASDPGVPFILESDLGASRPQKSVKEIYDFIISETTEALPLLPQNGKNGYHVNKAAGYALLARTYLFMKDYNRAKENAVKALAENKVLFDQIKYYNDNIALVQSPSLSPLFPRIDFTNPENYIFRYGGSMNMLQGLAGSAFLIAQKSRFEAGDTRLLLNFKPYAIGGDSIMMYVRRDDFNAAGFRTPEMHYIVAECEARAGNLPAAMEVLNTVRRKRILPDIYKDLTATSTKDAMDKIMRDKWNEYIGTGMRYLDLRRLNTEAAFATTLTKEFDGQALTLKPDSHLWIMPFSRIAMLKGENLHQNSK